MKSVRHTVNDFWVGITIDPIHMVENILEGLTHRSIMAHMNSMCQLELWDKTDEVRKTKDTSV